MIDLESYLEFLDTEFRCRFRAVIDQITLPIPRRVDQLTCWPGLRVIEVTPTGELRLSFKANPSKLRVGEYVYANTHTIDPKDVVSGPEGIIDSIDEEAKVAVVRAGYQQSGRFARRFRIDDMVVLDQTLPAAHTAREMPGLALRLLSGEEGDAPRLQRLRGLLNGQERPQPTGDAPFRPDAAMGLTPAQEEAVRAAIETDFTLIQGPPGTGKTFVLGLIIRELVRRGKKVGVCAFTHQAINNVLVECLRYDDIPEVCKVGAATSWTRDHHPRLEIVTRTGQYFRSPTTPAVTGFTQHAAFWPVARAAANGIDGALFDRFDAIVFDEAGQLTVPAAVMAMLQTTRFVFAGDHRQLPPVVETVRPGEGPGISVFQHLVEQVGHEPILLDRTYRMSAELVEFPSEEFYGGRLTSAPIAAARRLEVVTTAETAAILDPARPSTLALVRHEGRGQDSPEEAALVARLVDDAIRGGVPAEEIAVIAPHRRQNVKIRELLACAGHAGEHPVVDTVERIQGQERDLVILSMTISDPDVLSSQVDFLFLPNRFNVAITRARRKLVVIASPSFFRALPSPQALATHRRGGLADVNVLKRWYFRHREAAVDATATAERALAHLTTTLAQTKVREESAAV